MAFLPLVLRRGLQIAKYGADSGGALQQSVPTLQKADDALHALLSVVSAESDQTLACSALPGSMRPMRMVGGLDVLEFLPLVPTGFSSEVGGRQ